MKFLLSFSLFGSILLGMNLPNELQKKLTPFSEISSTAFYINGGGFVDCDLKENLDFEKKEKAFRLAIKNNALWVLIKFLKDNEMIRYEPFLKYVENTLNSLKRQSKKNGTEDYFMKETEFLNTQYFSKNDEEKAEFLGRMMEKIL